MAKKNDQLVYEYMAIENVLEGDVLFSKQVTGVKLDRAFSKNVGRAEVYLGKYDENLKVPFYLALPFGTLVEVGRIPEPYIPEIGDLIIVDDSDYITYTVDDVTDKYVISNRSKAKDSSRPFKDVNVFEIGKSTFKRVK